MNKDRRKALEAISSGVQELTVDNLREYLEALRDEEQEYYDNMPESLQGGDKGDQAQTAIDAMDSAISDLEGIDVDNIVNSIDEAAG